MKNLVIMLYVVLSGPFLQAGMKASSFGSGFQTLFENKNMHFIANARTGEKMVVTQSELVLSQAELEKFYARREFQNDVALPFGFITKSVQTSKKSTNNNLEITFNLYSYSPYTGSETVTYQKVIVTKNQLITMDYYPGKSGRSAEQIFNKVPQNPFSVKENKFSKFAMLFTPAQAAEDCSPKPEGLRGQIAGIIDSVKIDCSKPEYQEHGTAMSIRNAFKGCIAGLSMGAIEIVQFVVEAFDFLAKVVQDSSYRQELKSSIGSTTLLTQVDPRACAMSAVKMAVDGLKEAAGNFRACGLQYQALQVCRVVGYLIPPAALGVMYKVTKNVATKVAAKSAAKAAAKKEAAKAAVPKVTQTHMTQVFTETTEATQADWDEAMKAFQAAQKAEADKAAEAAAAKMAAEEARKKSLEEIGKNNQNVVAAEYHDADSDLAKEYGQYFVEQKEKAQKAAEELAAQQLKQRTEEAAAREAKKQADLQARINGHVPGRDIYELPKAQLPEGVTQEMYIRQLREENAQLLKDLGLDK